MVAGRRAAEGIFRAAARHIRRAETSKRGARGNKKWRNASGVRFRT
jgi:hypothetical protein